MLQVLNAARTYADGHKLRFKSLLVSGNKDVAAGNFLFMELAIVDSREAATVVAV